MNNLLNNWLVQALIGNIVCFIFARIAKWIYNDIKNSKSKSIEKPLSKYSKKTLRKQFYISFACFITGTPLFFLTSNQYLKALSLIMMFFGMFLIYCSFECALECFNDNIDNRG